MSENLKDISVVIPTLNCRHLLEPVMDTLCQTLSLTEEVVVVDSHSEDGTLEYLREHLVHPNVQFHSRPKGLYAAWNYGIQQCTREWIYISTAGDAMDADDLRFLHTTAIETDSDVVCAPPVFVDERGVVREDRKWPIFEILRDHGDEDLVSVTRSGLACFALRHGRPSRHCRGWLGSSASNLYRSETLKANPFPTEVGRSGDTFWGIENANKVNAVFCRRRCGRFVIHPHDASAGISTSQPILERYRNVCSEVIDWILGEVADDGRAADLGEVIEDFLAVEGQMLTKVRALKGKVADRRRRLKMARRELKAIREEMEQVRKNVPRVFHRFVFPSPGGRRRKERSKKAENDAET